MEFSGRGFKSHSGQLSIATSNNPSMVNTTYIYIYIYISKKDIQKASVLQLCMPFFENVTKKHIQQQDI